MKKNTKKNFTKSVKRKIKINFTGMKKAPKKIKKPPQKRLKIELPFEDVIKAPFTPKQPISKK